MTQRQDLLHPAIALFAAAPLAAFAPQDSEAVGTLSNVIRRFHTLDVQKYPQRLPFPLQPSGKRPGFVLRVGLGVAKVDFFIGLLGHYMTSFFLGNQNVKISHIHEVVISLLLRLRDVEEYSNF